MMTSREGIEANDIEILRQLIALVDAEINDLNGAIDLYNVTIRDAVQDVTLDPPLASGFLTPDPNA